MDACIIYQICVYKRVSSTDTVMFLSTTVAVNVVLETRVSFGTDVHWPDKRDGSWASFVSSAIESENPLCSF